MSGHWKSSVWRVVRWGFGCGVVAQLLVVAVVSAVGVWSSDPVNWQRVWSSDPTIGWRGLLAYDVASRIVQTGCFAEPPVAFKALFWGFMLGSAGLIGVIGTAVAVVATTGARRLFDSA